MLNIALAQPPIFKAWFGLRFWVVTSRPRDLEIISGQCLGQCFDRWYLFRFLLQGNGDGLLTSERE